MTDTATKTNDKGPWLRRLAGDRTVRTHDGEPDYGFYRVRQKALRTWWPVAFWYDKEGALKCRYNGKMIEEDRARVLWHGASEHAITAELFKQVDDEIRAGGRARWPGENDVVTRAYLAPDESSLEKLQAAIAEVREEADALLAAGPSKDEDEVEQAADVADYLASLHKRADAARVVEKAPHLQACRDVDAKWGVLIAAAEVYKRVKQLTAPWLKEKQAEKERREAEARREAAEKLQAALAAEEAARVAANEAAEAAASVQPGSNTAPFAEEIAAEAQAKAQTAIREANEAKQQADDIASERVTVGSRGKTHLRTETVVTIDDYAKALAYVKDHSEIVEAVTKLVTRIAKTGVQVPGVSVAKEKKAA